MKNQEKSRDRYRIAVKALPRKPVVRLLADKVPVSDLADEYRLQPSLIYLWIKQLLDQAERAFQQSANRKRRRATFDAKDRRIAQLETTNAQVAVKLAQKDAKLAHKNEVTAVLLEDNVRSKTACSAESVGGIHHLDAVTPYGSLISARSSSTVF